MSRKGTPAPRRRQETPHGPTDGPQWLAESCERMVAALEADTHAPVKGGKHRPAPPDEDLRRIARDLDAVRRDTK